MVRAAVVELYDRSDRHLADDVFALSAVDEMATLLVQPIVEPPLTERVPQPLDFGEEGVDVFNRVDDVATILVTAIRLNPCADRFEVDHSVHPLTRHFDDMSRGP